MPTRPTPPEAAGEEPPFVHRRTITWGDTDPARMAYTGRFPDFMLEAIEAWFRARLDTDWYRLNVDEGMGTPFVNLAMDFKSPVTPREAIDIAVRVARVGTSSLSFAVEALSADTRRLCFTGSATCVFVDAQRLKPIPIPEKYRERLVAPPLPKGELESPR
jgi:4-hydroxybenzoyl-CoA thioesterase